jgi:hypothetical protein
MNQSTRTEAWVELARSTKEDDFLTRFPGYFLLAGEEAAEFTVTEETRVADFGAAAKIGDRIPSFEVRWVASAHGSDVITVGRDAGCDVVFRDLAVSKLHAQFRVERDGVTIMDLHSRNGTRLNRRLLVPEQPEQISAHDRLDFGGVKAMVIDAIEMRVLLFRLS